MILNVLLQSIRVLHVTEAAGGGVGTALASYARSTPHVEHGLLRIVARRVESKTQIPGMEDLGQMSAGLTLVPRQFHRVVSKFSPDVIHIHSSIAGALIRVLPRRVENAPLVYTPHCYAFEREDLRTLSAWSYRMVERVLAPRASYIAACSEREAMLSRQLASHVPVLVVPNAPTPGVVPAASVREDREVPVVVGVGRLAKQKDPGFFLAAIDELRRKANIDAVWIGGGGELAREATEAGVRVTGWIPHAEALDEMARASAYLHSAAWEGFPMSVLEASSLALPTVVRDIGAFSEVPTELKVKDPASAALRLAQIVRDQTAAEDNVRVWRETLRANTLDDQGRALMEVYRRVLAE